MTITRLPRAGEHETKDHYDLNETDDMHSLLLELAFNCFGQDLQVSQLDSKNSASDHDFGIMTESLFVHFLVLAVRATYSLAVT